MEKIKRVLNNKWFLGACRVLLGFLFVVASIGKIIDPHEFAKDVYSYAILPGLFVPAFAAIIPWIEFIAGILLMLNIKAQSNALIINGLLIMFLTAIAIDVARGIEISCGCFDFLFPEEEVGWKTILRDSVMLIPGVIILFFDKNEIRIPGLKRKY